MKAGRLFSGFGRVFAAKDIQNSLKIGSVGIMSVGKLFVSDGGRAHIFPVCRRCHME